MKKIFLILLFTFLIIDKSYAASATGPATKYEVIVKKVELCKDVACTDTYVVGEKDFPADIAGADAGAQVGSFASTEKIPAGTYSHLRVTMDRSMNVIASVTVGSGLCRTDGGNNASYTQMTLGASSGTAVSEEMEMVTAGGFAANNGTRGTNNIMITYDEPKHGISMTVSNDITVVIYKLEEPYTRLLKTPLIKIEFDTSNAIGADNTACAMWIEEPTVTISID